MTQAVTTEQLSADAVSRRADILRQLKKNLLKQRERLVGYLDILEREDEDIREVNLEKLTAHVDMEQAVIREIRSFQKVIDPLEKLYRAAYPEKEEEIPALKSSLADLTGRILQRNRANQALLRQEMARIEGELSRMRIPVRSRSIYNLQETSTILDITT